MIKSAVTISLVDEARGGPFVFWSGLADAFSQAAELGYDGIEIFAPGPDVVDRQELAQLCEQHGLLVAAVGTGAGMVKHGLNLTDANDDKRLRAKEFIRSMIDFGADFSAPAIIGSMQGRWSPEVPRDRALSYLAESLNELGAYAAQRGVQLLYEPLNRYETNLLKTLGEGVQFLATLATANVKLLADLFHMNIEESDLAAAIRQGAGNIGHIHFVDSNRQAAGRGHLDFAPIADAIQQCGFSGYMSAEALPVPDSRTAAETTISTFRRLFR